MPLVSVIVPVFNGAPFLSQALDSVIAQTFADLEIVVVDDGSSDSSSEIAQRYAEMDSRVQLIRQPNLGVGAARNTAIAAAKGDYIAPLDADDVWYPEKLAKQVAFLESHGAGWGFAYCWSRIIDVTGTLVGSSTPWTYAGDIFHTLIYRNIVGNASVPLFRAAALRKVDGYLTREQQGGAQGCEDWHLTLKVAAISYAGAVPDHLVGYRRYSESMSGNVLQMAASYEAAIRELRQREPRVPANLLRWSIGNFYTYLTMSAYSGTQYRNACRLLMRALGADPAVLANRSVWRVLTLGVLRAMLESRGALAASPKTGQSGAPAKKPASPRVTYFNQLQARRHELLAKNQRSLIFSGDKNS